MATEGLTNLWAIVEAGMGKRKTKDRVRGSAKTQSEQYSRVRSWMSTNWNLLTEKRADSVQLRAVHKCVFESLGADCLSSYTGEWQASRQISQIYHEIESAVWGVRSIGTAAPTQRVCTHAHLTPASARLLGSNRYMNVSFRCGCQTEDAIVECGPVDGVAVVLDLGAQREFAYNALDATKRTCDKYGVLSIYDCYHSRSAAIAGTVLSAIDEVLQSLVLKYAGSIATVDLFDGAFDEVHECIASGWASAERPPLGMYACGLKGPNGARKQSGVDLALGVAVSARRHSADGVVVVASDADLRMAKRAGVSFVTYRHASTAAALAEFSLFQIAC